MLIEISQIVAVQIGEEVFHWALLPSEQLVALPDSTELQEITTRKADFAQTFTVLAENITILRWRVEEKTNIASPMHDILLFAKILVSERNHLYPILTSYLQDLKIPYKDRWLFPGKRNFFHFLFTQMYESWKYSEQVIEEVEKKIFDKHCELWKMDYAFADFLNWIKEENTFYVKVIGEEFHVNLDELKQLHAGDTLNLLTDPLNKYDAKAVSVYDVSGKQIGFLRRTISDKLFQRLINETPQATILYIDCHADKNERICIELKLT